MIYYNKLMKVDLSYGHLDEIKNYKLEDVTELNLSSNDLKELPKWIDKCINLQILYCSFNQLTSLPENLPASLQRLSYSSNQLTSLPESFPNSLQYLYCSCNQLVSLPESLPNSLQELYCGNNQLTSLPENLPTSLQKLYCSGNKLTSLPMSILNCRFLTVIDKSNNQIENIHPAITRFINRTKNRNMTVYNDKQSVHNGNVQESVRQSIINILSTRLD
jgi:Leucine-rich repeat (LRR) protein